MTVSACRFTSYRYENVTVMRTHTVILTHRSIVLQHLLPLGEYLAERRWNSLSHVTRVNRAELTREASQSV